MQTLRWIMVSELHAARCVYSENRPQEQVLDCLLVNCHRLAKNVLCSEVAVNRIASWLLAEVSSQSPDDALINEVYKKCNKDEVSQMVHFALRSSYLTRLAKSLHFDAGNYELTLKTLAQGAGVQLSDFGSDFQAEVGSCQMYMATHGPSIFLAIREGL